MTILCTIDLLTRGVLLPADQRIAAYDHNVDIIHFQAEPIEDFSLDTSTIRIAAQGPNKARHDYAVDPSTVSIEEETGYITFDWPIPAGVTEMPIGTFKYGDKGNLIFAVCAEIISGDTVSKAWHSDDGIITVVAHLEPESGGGEDPEEEATNAQKIAQLQTNVAVMRTQIGAVAGGVPAVVDSVSDMTDTGLVYILSSDGYWYYYDGSAWTQGGVYGGAVTDTTLSISGSAADAKAVGEALATKADADDVGDLSQLTTTAKDNLVAAINETNEAITETNGRLDQYEDVFTGDVDESVQNWLDEHPEATTTVQDGSLTEAKLSNALKFKAIKDYVTPEMFGAVGDGVTDDSEAVQAAINDGRPVRGFNSYFLDSTIDILTDNKNIEFFGSLKSNKTPAVRISTSSSVIKIKRIETIAQDGVCVLFDGTSRTLTYNKFAFSQLKAGTQSNPGFACIHILVSGEKWFNENRIDCGRFISGLWGIYADGSHTTSSYSCIEGNVFIEPIIENNHYGIYLNFCYNTTIILSRNSSAEIPHFITTDGICTRLTIFNRYAIIPRLYDLSSNTTGCIIGGLPASGSISGYSYGYGVVLIKNGRLFNPGNALYLNLSSYQVNGTVDLNTIDDLDDFYQPTVMYLSDSTTTLILSEHYGTYCGINEFSIITATSRPLTIQKNGSTVLTIPKLMKSGGITKVYYDNQYGWYYTVVDGNRKLGYEKPTTKTVTVAGLVFVISKSGYIVNVSISSGSFDNTYKSNSTLGNISENANSEYNPTTTVQIINAYSADSRISITENGTIKVLTNNTSVGQGDLFRGSLTYMAKV